MGNDKALGLVMIIKVENATDALTFSRSTPNTLENSSCLVDSGFPKTKTRNLGHGARNADGGVNSAGLVSLPLEVVSSPMVIDVQSSLFLNCCCQGR